MSTSDPVSVDTESRWQRSTRIAAQRFSLIGAAVRHLPRLLANQIGRVDVEISENRDFGNIVDRGPQRVEMVEDADGVVDLFERAKREGVSVHLRGSGHSINGQTLSAGGFQLRYRPRDRTIFQVGDGTVEVSGACTWGDVAAHLDSRNMAMGLLPGWLHTTVAGTSSVGGGVGGTSPRIGRGIDLVEKLRLILPTGEQVWVSPREESELFHNALGGMGSIGVIDRAVLRTETPRPWTVTCNLSATSLVEGVEQLCSVIDRGPDEIDQAVVVANLFGSRAVMSSIGFQHRSLAEAKDHRRRISASLPDFMVPVRGRVGSIRAARDVHPHDRVRAQEALYNGAARAWGGFFFSAVEPCLDYVRALQHAIEDPPGGERPFVLFVPVKKNPVAHGRFSYDPTAPGSHVFFVDLLWNVVDPKVLPDVEARIQRLHRRAVEVGGRFYMYGWHELGVEDVRTMYGDHYELWCRAKRRADPAGLLSPGVLPIED